MHGVAFTGWREIEMMAFSDLTSGPREDLGAMVGLADHSLAMI